MNEITLIPEGIALNSKGNIFEVDLIPLKSKEFLRSNGVRAKSISKLDLLIFFKTSLGIYQSVNQKSLLICKFPMKS